VNTSDALLTRRAERVFPEKRAIAVINLLEAYREKQIFCNFTEERSYLFIAKKIGYSRKVASNPISGFLLSIRQMKKSKYVELRVDGRASWQYADNRRRQITSASYWEAHHFYKYKCNGIKKSRI
jgi:hypothetical protein